MSGGPLVHARLIAIGDELLAGLHPDLNSPEIASRFGEAGIKVLGAEVVSDDEPRIERAVRTALEDADLVVVTGGLGPTLDDVTRFGIARAFDVGVVESAEAVSGLKAWFDERAVPMSPMNLRQALLPEGATLVHNRVGTAPGFRVERVRGERRQVVISLPGPPREMRVVLNEEVLPWLATAGLATEPLVAQRFHLFGLGESVFAERAGDWMDRAAELPMGCSVKGGVLSVVIRDPARRTVEFEARVLEFRQRFAEHIFSEDDGRVEHVLGRELLRTGTTVALAESCTGGLATALLTEVPGISAVFAQAKVTYSDAAKHTELGVPTGLLDAHGAVSSEVAAAMAEGIARTTGARLGISITGVAGPDGGTDEKPVGLVWFGTTLDGETLAQERRFPPGERTWIRRLAARHALFLGLQRLRQTR